VDRGRVVGATAGKDAVVVSSPGDGEEEGRSSRVRERSGDRPLAVVSSGEVELRVSRAGGVRVALEPGGPRLFRGMGRDSPEPVGGVWIKLRMKGGGELPGEPLANAGWYKPGMYSSLMSMSAANAFLKPKPEDPGTKLTPLRAGEATVQTTVGRLTAGYDRDRSQKLHGLDEMEFKIRIVPSEMGLFTENGKRAGKEVLKDLETEWLPGDEVRTGK
jgi:hypothetical protein